jgi:L-alanine-DL-glutamate epimerase-like enolase superfamily enzyme
MEVAGISLYTVPLAIDASLTRYVIAKVRAPRLDTLVVRIDTDEGLTGWGEACAAPPYYLPELSAATREGILYLAPLIVGRDPRQVRPLYRSVEQSLRGHGSAKSAIDMALWDLAAKAVGLPLADYWGGRVANEVPVFAVVSIGSRDDMAASLATYRTQGYSRFQIKIGAGTPQQDIELIRDITAMVEPNERIWFDPNRAWSVEDAVRVILTVKHLVPMIENPCESYEECKVVAHRTGVPFMLDEVIDSPRRFVQAAMDGVMDVASLKLNSLGGLSKLRFLTDLGVELGIPMRIENYGGTGILLSAVTHLAQTLPERNVFGLYDYVTPELPLVRNPLEVRAGSIGIRANAAPGLGVEVDEAILGDPVAVLKG